MSQKNSIGQSGPASIRLVPVTGAELLDIASMQATIDMLAPAYSAGVKAGLDGQPCEVPSGLLPGFSGRSLEQFNAGHLRGRQIAQTTVDGSPSMLAEPTRTIMAGNGVIEAPEAFDEFTGPIDPGSGIVEKCHGHPLGEIDHAVILPPAVIHSFPRVAGLPSPEALGSGDALSSSGALAAPRDTSTPAASASVAGAFTLSDNQRASLQRMAQIATSTGNFDLMFSQIEGLVHADRFDRAITEGGKAIDKAFGHAAEMVRIQTRKARNACPKCGKSLEYTPAERETNTAGGYDCSDPDCGYSAPLE